VGHLDTVCLTMQLHGTRPYIGTLRRDCNCTRLASSGACLRWYVQQFFEQRQ
jgi:hypothetical protein